jgi:citrate/tricarballylate utilization protein
MSAIDLAALATGAQQEVSRQLAICNACRYCEGLCAVFPAMELRKSFPGGDADYLANLCHECGACFYDCQYAPPHEFAVNIPVAMAELREESYARYAWPAAFAVFFARNGLWVTIAAALSVAGFIAGFVAWRDASVLFGVHVGEGAFYRLMPHDWMVGIFGAAFLYAILAIAMGVRAFWRASGPPLELDLAAFWRAIRDAATLRYLDGGGMGCMNEDERPEKDRRRLYHHLTFYGFLLCFASTSSGTIASFWQDAPYPWWHPTVVLGVLGGIGLIAGPLGLLGQRGRRDPAMAKRRRTGMGEAFLWMLLATSVTGLLLLVLRATPAMGMLLALHLGIVFALFLSFPYGKFVHGIYRFTALVRHAAEQRAAHPALNPECDGRQAG